MQQLRLPVKCRQRHMSQQACADNDTSRSSQVQSTTSSEAVGCMPAAGQCLLTPDTWSCISQQIQQHARKLEDSALQPVPLVWVGVAQEARSLWRCNL